jgi:hypothetical protein
MDDGRMNRFKKYRHTPKGRFTRHKANAKRRGVPFEIEFEEWLHFWGDKLGNPDYVMCRPGDEGPYAWWNVYIGTKADNLMDMLGWRRGGPRIPQPDWDAILGPAKSVGPASRAETLRYSTGAID